MKIQQIHIKNFRGYKDEVIDLDSLTSFVGANGTGKSSVLSALNVFFGEPQNSLGKNGELESHDFHLNDTTKEIEIKVTFSELTTKEQGALSHYYRHGKLILAVVAKKEPDSEKIHVQQFGYRLVMEDFAKYFKQDDDGALVSVLRETYAEIRKKYNALSDESTKAAMKSALSKYETEHPDLCVEIPSNDNFYGISKVGKLNKFIQWVYVPAVKDASEEQNDTRGGALEKLLERTVRAKLNFDDQLKKLHEDAEREYQKLLTEKQGALADISSKLSGRIAEWSSSEVKLIIKWKSDPNSSVQISEPFAELDVEESNFTGKLNRMGHGLQRSYLLSLLQELAATSLADEQPKLILGCEEPELYQHPPQLRNLSATFAKLVEEGSQVILSTHSPIFVSGRSFEGVRACRKEAGKFTVSRLNRTEYLEQLKLYDDSLKGEMGLNARLSETLQPQIAEMFFGKRIIFVEGGEDQAFLLSYFSLWEGLADFRKSGAHIIPVNGKSHLIRPLILAKLMKIPLLVMFDSDSDADEKNGAKKMHEKDNAAIIKVMGSKIEPFPKENIFEDRLICWKTNIGAAFKEDCGDKSPEIENELNSFFGQMKSLNKNALAIGRRLELAKEKGITPRNISTMASAVLKFCKTA